MIARPLLRLLLCLLLSASDGVSVEAQTFTPAAAPEDSTALRQLFLQGQSDASQDLSGGTSKVKWFGLPRPYWPDFRSSVAQQYGVDIEFGPDWVEPEQDAYWSGYNGVVLNALEPQFGCSFLDEAFGEAARDYRQIRPGDVLNPEVVRDLPMTTAAREAEARGLVLVRLDITPAGEGTNVRLARGPGYGLDELAVEAAQRLRFAPAKDQANGKEVENVIFLVRFE